MANTDSERIPIAHAHVVGGGEVGIRRYPEGGGPATAPGGPHTKTGIFLHLANAAMLVSGVGGDPMQAVGGVTALYATYKDKWKQRKEEERIAESAFYQCAECGDTFGTYDDATSRMKDAHHQDTQPMAAASTVATGVGAGGGFKFQCADCGIVNTDIAEAMRHAEASHGSSGGGGAPSYEYHSPPRLSLSSPLLLPHSSFTSTFDPTGGGGGGSFLLEIEIKILP